MGEGPMGRMGGRAENLGFRRGRIFQTTGLRAPNLSRADARVATSPAAIVLKGTIMTPDLHLCARWLISGAYASTSVLVSGRRILDDPTDPSRTQSPAVRR